MLESKLLEALKNASITEDFDVNVCFSIEPYPTAMQIEVLKYLLALRDALSLIYLDDFIYIKYVDTCIDKIHTLNYSILPHEFEFIELLYSTYASV